MIFCSVKENISCANFFIFGSPGETEKSVRDGLKNIRKLEQSVIFIYSGIRILPGTELYIIALNEGVVSKKDSLLKPSYYFSPAVDIKKMNELIENEVTRSRRYIFPPEKGKRMADAMRFFKYKGILWDHLLSSKSNRKRKIMKNAIQ